MVQGAKDGPKSLFFDVLYRRLWSSILISSFGNQVTLLALPLTAAVVLHATPTQMGYLVACEILPFAVLSLPAGVWVDRWRKLPTYVVGELAVAFCVVAVPLAWWLGVLSMPWLYTVAFVIGCINTVAGSASQVVLTQIVPRERLVEAHAKKALATSTAEVTGPAVAGVLIQAIGAAAALLTEAVLLIASAVMLCGIRVRESIEHSREGFWQALFAGLQFVRRQKLLMLMAGCVAAWQLCLYMVGAVQILFATRDLGMSERDVGLSYVAIGAGTATAGLVGHWVVRRLGVGVAFALGFAVSGAGWLLLASAPVTALGVGAYTFMLLSYGASAVLIFMNFLSLRQSLTPAPMLGRMTSTMRWLIFLPAGPGALLGGWLGEQLSLRVVLGLAGVVSVLLAALLLFRFPSLVGQAPRQSDLARSSGRGA